MSRRSLYSLRLNAALFSMKIAFNVSGYHMFELRTRYDDIIQGSKINYYAIRTAPMPFRATVLMNPLLQQINIPADELMAFHYKQHDKTYANHFYLPHNVNSRSWLIYPHQPTVCEKLII